MGWIAVAALAGALDALADDAHLAAAERAAQELRLNDAASELELASRVEGNSRATVLRILELQGVVAASLRQAKRAETYFRQLLALDPSHALSTDYAPRVATPFFEAKSWVAVHGSLRAEARPPVLDGAAVTALRVTVSTDPLKAARRVRFHLRSLGGEWTAAVVPLESGAAEAPTKGARVDWWAEVLGENQAQLFLLGTEEAPLAAATPPPPPREEAAATLLPPPPIASASARVPAAPAYRPLSYVLMGLGVAAGATGVVCGYQSSHDLALINDASRDPSGTVVGMTQRRAFDLASHARTEARWGNSLMGAGAGLVLGGALVWWLGRDGSSTVSLAVQPGGLALTGTFP
ncbi:MAG TPA: hypothetical protein VH208_05085 [Myxococcaceae bacterium]|jgi:hypothetical protein|nr:hypothetical protein [Myxococcaceae bacterium]